MKKTHKWLVYIVLGIILKAAIVLIFVLAFLRTRAPKLRFSSVSVQRLQTLTFNSSLSSASFAMELKTQITVKNNYLGKFEFGDSTVTMFALGYPVGEAVIGKGKAKAMSTKKMDVSVSLSSEKVTAKRMLASDLESGKLGLWSRGTLKGKVRFFKVIKRKKTAEMNCRMDLITNTKAIENLHCD